jgi:hypothetical protein
VGWGFLLDNKPHHGSHLLNDMVYIEKIRMSSTISVQTIKCCTIESKTNANSSFKIANRVLGTAKINLSIDVKHAS